MSISRAMGAAGRARVVFVAFVAAALVAPALSAGATTQPAARAGAEAAGVAAVRGLLSRLIPDHAALFSPRLLTASACSGDTGLCFGYGAGKTAGTVELRGTSGVELAMALNHYLKYVANASISWAQTGGNQLYLPPVRALMPIIPLHFAPPQPPLPFLSTSPARPLELVLPILLGLAYACLHIPSHRVSFPSPHRRSTLSDRRPTTTMQTSARSRTPSCGTPRQTGSAKSIGWR